jgi:hypothetical protein
VDDKPGRQERAIPAGLSTALVIGALLAGALGGILASPLTQGGMATGAEERAQPPLVILSVADALMAGRDARAIRALAERFADGGFLVLDAQAVLAAPAELYLPLAEGQDR